ncbi:hypothetical protein L227DRAFT_572289 [Lentinus tigrinus ALCF2SS1-6]|uniref:Uncharacterized protein n=1 Tax=Lentinus tigrinus ALCF2SS1-6 TaxID=1328759 RepID=A0A5C2SKN4_9APHY|nr:hypothetical protein L227DRAFT_572289 [Lentinus tigrinus ALCF2SS1-6]
MRDNKSLHNHNLEHQHRSEDQGGIDATDAGTSTPSSRRSGNAPRTHQGSTRKRKAPDNPPAAPSTKRHRKAARNKQSQPPGLVEEESRGEGGKYCQSLEMSSSNHGHSSGSGNAAETGKVHDDKPLTVLDQLEHPEDGTKLGADLYDELNLEAGWLVMPDSTTPPPPTEMPSKGTSQSASKPKLTPKTHGESETKTRSSWKCPFTTNPSCAARTFTRVADRDRHILSTHLSISVVCTHQAHTSPARLSRPDAVSRHMGKPCCLGAVRYNALKRKYARQLGADPDGWEGRRAVHQKYIRIRMPCYRREDFREALAKLKVSRTVKGLEEWLSGYGKVERCMCVSCRMQPQPARTPAVAYKRTAKRGTNSEAGLSGKRARRKALVASVVDEEDERLPPEEEEGVDKYPSGSSPAEQDRHTPDSLPMQMATRNDICASAGPSEHTEVINKGDRATTVADTIPDTDADQAIEMHAAQTADLEDMLESDPTWGSGAVISMS